MSNITLPTISLCMITKNEEEFLGQCLGSVKGLVDEIIVVDTGSTDKTKEIAIRFGAKVFDFKWCDDFSAARNESLKHANGDWILVLDADEVLSEQNFCKLRELIKNEMAKKENSNKETTNKELINNDEIMGWSLVQRNYTNNPNKENFIYQDNDCYLESKNYLGWSASLIVRLFKNNLNIKFSGAVHELVEPAIKSLQGKIELLDIPIHHYQESKDKVKQEEKVALYEKLSEKKVQKDPSAKNYHELGVIQKVRGENDKAILSLNKALELQPNFLLAKYHLGVANNNKNDYLTALPYFDEIIVLKPSFTDAYFSKAVSLVGLGRLEEARQILEKGLNLQPHNFHALTNLGAVLEKLGDYKMAEIVLLKVLQKAPQYARAYHVLGVIFERQNRLQEAARNYLQATNLDDSKAVWFKDLGMIWHRLGHHEKAYKAFQMAIKLNPEYKKIISL